MFAPVFAISLIWATSSAVQDHLALVHKHGRCDSMCPNDLIKSFSSLENVFVSGIRHLEDQISLQSGYQGRLNASDIQVEALGYYLGILNDQIRIMDQGLESLADKVRQNGVPIRRQKRSTPDQCGVQKYPKSCRDVKQSDPNSVVYTIKPKGAKEPFLAACNFEYEEGGWTIIQRREDGSVNFTQTYESYTHGFGNVAGEFWLGLEKIHQLTGSSMYELVILLTDYENVTKDARYSIFKVGSEATGYRLSLSGYSGDAGDSMETHNNQKFSTIDKDQDTWETDSCAVVHGGAWWYNNCTGSNLNGQYLKGEYKATQPFFNGTYWGTFKGRSYSLQKTLMMIRPQPCDCNDSP